MSSFDDITSKIKSVKGSMSKLEEINSGVNGGYEEGAPVYEKGDTDKVHDTILEGPEVGGESDGKLTIDDFLIYHASNGGLEYDEDELQSLCDTCNIREEFRDAFKNDLEQLTRAYAENEELGVAYFNEKIVPFVEMSLGKEPEAFDGDYEPENTEKEKDEAEAAMNNVRKATEDLGEKSMNYKQTAGDFTTAVDNLVAGKGTPEAVKEAADKCVKAQNELALAREKAEYCAKKFEKEMAEASASSNITGKYKDQIAGLENLQKETEENFKKTMETVEKNVEHIQNQLESSQRKLAAYKDKVKAGTKDIGQRGFSAARAMADPNGNGGLQVVEAAALAGMAALSGGAALLKAFKEKARVSSISETKNALLSAKKGASNVLTNPSKMDKNIIKAIVERDAENDGVEK